MPKTKLQEIVFTILMVFVMVYAMICYNIALNMGGMSNVVFLNAFHELIIMGPLAFILDFFLYGSLSKKLAFRIVTPGVDKPIMLILAISSITVCLMCPTMSLAATLLFKHAGKEAQSARNKSISTLLKPRLKPGGRENQSFREISENTQIQSMPATPNPTADRRQIYP